MIYSNSLKNYIYQKIKSAYPNYVNGGEIERFALDEKFKASNASRRLRELYQAGLLERRINKDSRNSVEYRWLPPLPKSPEEQEKESEKRLIQALL